MAITRQELIENLIVVLKTITTANGYHLNIGNNVFPWRSTPVSAAEKPALIVSDRGRDVPGEATADTTNKQDHALTVDINVICDTQVQARQGIQDILKAVNVDYTLSGKAWDVRDGGDQMFVDHQGERVFSPQLTLEYSYRTNRFQEN